MPRPVRALLLALMGAIAIPSMATAQTVSSSDDAQAVLEDVLGFALPHPYAFQPFHDTPLYIHCNEPEGSGCPHGEQGHLDISGIVAQALYLPHWPGAPRFRDLLVQNGWVTVGGQETVDGYVIPTHYEMRVPALERSETEPERACLRELEFHMGYLDAVAITVHIYPCASFE